MNGWAIASLVLFALAASLTAALFLVIRQRSIAPGGQPTDEEKRIVLEGQSKRLQIVKETTVSGAEVKRMSDEELERAVNGNGGSD